MQLAILGVILALLFEKTHSLWPPIMLHALNNSLIAITCYRNKRTDRLQTGGRAKAATGRDCLRATAALAGGARAAVAVEHCGGVLVALEDQAGHPAGR